MEQTDFAEPVSRKNAFFFQLLIHHGIDHRAQNDAGESPDQSVKGAISDGSGDGSGAIAQQGEADAEQESANDRIFKGSPLRFHRDHPPGMEKTYA